MRCGLTPQAFIPLVPLNTPSHPSFSVDMHNRGNKQLSACGTATPRATFKPTPSDSGKKRRYYAVRFGRDGFNGVLNTWEECKRYVHGVPKAVHKSFKKMEDAQAYIRLDGSTSTASTKKRGSTTSPGKITITTNDQSNTQDHGRNRESTRQQDSSKPANDLYSSTSARELLADSPDATNEAPKELHVYTDGACAKNGRAGACAGYGVYFGQDNPYNISAPLKENPTNQRAELTAVLEAMKVTLAHGLVADGGQLIIYTDSQVRFPFC